MVLKPGNSARTVYGPASRPGTTYCPTSSTVNVRERPLCTSVTVMVAPGIKAPVWSATLPRIRQSSACGKAGTQTSNRPRPPANTRSAILRPAKIDFVEPDVKEFKSPSLLATSSDFFMTYLPCGLGREHEIPLCSSGL